MGAERWRATSRDKLNLLITSGVGSWAGQTISREKIKNQNKNKFKAILLSLFMEEVNYQEQVPEENNLKIRDLEEKQRILKDRVLLIGQNLIDSKEKTTEDILEIKKDLEKIKDNLEKIRRFIESVSTEFSKFARKDDLDILIKQAKMFQPLRYLKENAEES